MATGSATEPKELIILGDYISNFDFLNISETQRRIDTLVSNITEQTISKFSTVEDFKILYIADQIKCLATNSPPLKDLKEADDLISKKEFKSALKQLFVKLPAPIKIKFKNVPSQLRFEQENKLLKLNKGDLARSYLTLASNLENIDTLLINSKTSNSPIKSLEYKNKSNVLSEICNNISKFYDQFPGLKEINDDVGDEIRNIEANPPAMGDDNSIKIKYHKTLTTLYRKRTYQPWYTRNFLKEYYFPNFYDQITHTKKEELIEGFITDIQKNIFPEWIEDLKKERRTISAHTTNAKRKAKRKFLSRDYKAEVRDFFKSNPNSTQNDCAKALGIDPKTVRKHLK